MARHTQRTNQTMSTIGSTSLIARTPSASRTPSIEKEKERGADDAEHHEHRQADEIEQAGHGDQHHEQRRHHAAQCAADDEPEDESLQQQPHEPNSQGSASARPMSRGGPSVGPHEAVRTRRGRVSSRPEQP
jgi:hypothetical protein